GAGRIAVLAEELAQVLAGLDEPGEGGLLEPASRPHLLLLQCGRRLFHRLLRLVQAGHRPGPLLDARSEFRGRLPTRPRSSPAGGPPRRRAWTIRTARRYGSGSRADGQSTLPELSNSPFRSRPFRASGIRACTAGCR